MGNVLQLLCMCKEASVMVQATAAGAKKTKRIKRPAAAKNVVVRSDQDVVDDEVMKKRAAWPGCRVQQLADEEYGVRVKVVMTRKDAVEFMARLEERAAVERKDRMGELVGGVMSRCCGAWRPGLATIPEN